MDILLIGHRTSGKTTLASALGTLHPHLFEVIDLDALIEREEERTCAQIIADHEPYFRELERAYLDRVLAAPSRTPHRIIVPGAGCQHLPFGPAYVWVQRDGWIDSAMTQRARLRARRSFEEEVAWMKATREPRWAARAHAIFSIARGSRMAFDIQRLSEMILALLQAPESPTTKKSWLVLQDVSTLERAVADVRLLGFAGLEVRSDFFPTDAEALAEQIDVMASLRTPDVSWFARVAPHARALDVDVEFFDDVKHLLDDLTPRQLILSAHPARGEDLVRARETLVRLAQDVCARLPDWAEHLVLKFAPHHDNVREALHTLDAMHTLGDQFKVTHLPQGHAYAWMRPWLVAHLNATNYLPVTLHARTTGVDMGSDSPAALDFHQWLPHLTATPPSRFDALLGDPVHQSIGDWWHRMAALREHTPELGYLKIPVARDLDPDAWRHHLRLFSALAIRGLSITAPHKRTMASHEDVLIVDEHAFEAVNTLRDHASSSDRAPNWIAIDTDHMGMIATLDALEQEGVVPGQVAIIGQGGVSHAVRRAFEARQAWTLVHHASARQGWGEDAPARVELVINAAGDHDAVYVDAPACEAWVDLHYRGVRAPASGRVHLNGETFFVAQASAQRAFWADTTPSTR